MKRFWIILLTLCIAHTAIGVINVVVHVPATPNTFFPNTLNSSSTASTAITTTTPEPMSPPSAKSTRSKDYFKTLFDEVKVTKKTPPTISSVKLHDKLAEDSVALGILKEYPYLSIGTLAFRPLNHKAVHRPEIQRGQELLLDNFGSKILNYKELTELIDQRISDPNSPITDRDWILMYIC